MINQSIYWLKKKYKRIRKNKKFYKIILLTYKSQAIEYSKIAIAMQGGQCLLFFVLFKGGDAHVISFYEFYRFN